MNGSPMNANRSREPDTTRSDKDALSSSPSHSARNRFSTPKRMMRNVFWRCDADYYPSYATARSLGGEIAKKRAASLISSIRRPQRASSKSLRRFHVRRHALTRRCAPKIIFYVRASLSKYGHPCIIMLEENSEYTHANIDQIICQCLFGSRWNSKKYRYNFEIHAANVSYKYSYMYNLMYKFSSE